MKRSILIVTALLLALSGCSRGTESPPSSPQPVTRQQDPWAEGGPIDPDAVMEHDAVLSGPYGTLSLHLPALWDYDLLEPNNDDLRSGLYSIRFHPRRSSGYVEVGYYDQFGVCGTGLAEETVTLAGQEASKGVYDDHPYWDFIAWRGDLEGIAALQSEESGLGWSPQEQQTALEILDSVAFDRAHREGCIGFYIPESEAEELGLNLALRDISPAGATLVWNQWDPERAAGELVYGEGFSLERQEGTEWVPQPTCTDEIGFHDIAHSITGGQENTFPLDWSWLYGTLEPGTYRLCTSVTDGTGDNRIYELKAAFLVN